MLQNVRGALAINIETSRYYNQAYVFVNQLAKWGSDKTRASKRFLYEDSLKA